MALFRVKYRDKHGVERQSPYWSFEFLFHGKRIRESARTTRRTVAAEREKSRRRELELAYAGLPVEPAETRIKRVAESVKEYLRHYPSNHRPKSVIYTTQRLSHVERLLGRCLPMDLTEARIREYIAARLAEGAAGSSINGEVGELSRVLGFKRTAIWPRVRRLEVGEPVGRALAEAEEERLLRTAAADQCPNRNPLLYPFLQIALTTGMRGGEILALTWAQVDFAAGVLTVGKAKTRAGTGRQIPMNANLRATLEAHAAWYAHQKRFGELRPEWYLFPTRTGRPEAGQSRPWDPTKPLESIKTAWAALCKRAKVYCRPHDLRHTVATKMAEAGISESAMLSIMGHLSREMLEHYSHIRMAAKRVAVEALALPDLNPKADPIPSGVPKVSPKVPEALDQFRGQTPIPGW